MGTRPPGGFTLLEVLFAMTLFALMSTAINALTISAMHQTFQNRHGTTAVMLAQQEIDDLRSLAYDSINSRSSAVTNEGRSYSIDTRVRADTPKAGMKQITVTVSWPGLSDHDPQFYAIDTIFTSLSD